jgi:hypothetical protein
MMIAGMMNDDTGVAEMMNGGMMNFERPLPPPPDMTAADESREDFRRQYYYYRSS